MVYFKTLWKEIQDRAFVVAAMVTVITTLSDSAQMYAILLFSTASALHIYNKTRSVI